MLSTLVTIIVPCYNSLPDIKSTLENLIKQTKIRGTSVLVLDMGSKDGSFQYVTQASSELFNFLRIESINIKDNNDFCPAITTPYTLWLLPGILLENPDFILDCINKNSKKDLYIHPAKNQDLLKRIFSKYYLQSEELFLSFVFCKKSLINNIKYRKESKSMNITIKKSGLKKNYKIIKGKIGLYEKY